MPYWPHGGFGEQKVVCPDCSLQVVCPDSVWNLRTRQEKPGILVLTRGLKAAGSWTMVLF